MKSRRLYVTVPTIELCEAASDLEGTAEIVVWDMAGPAPAPSIDLVVPPYMSPPSVLSQLDSVTVQVVQSQSIGYDGVDAVLAGRAHYCNAAGVHEASTAELAIGLIIASLRGFPSFVRAQESGEWLFGRYQSLADKTVVILGYGGVGQAIATRLAPFETVVVPVASTARSTPEGDVSGISDLPDLLPRADVVVLAVPLSPATDGLVDRQFLAQMKPGALLVNVARGPVVDTAALTETVREGRIRVALDVTDPEPLPPEHPLWRLDGVLITPHIGGSSSAMLPRVIRLLRAQIAQLAAGEPPLNVVLPRRSDT